VQDHGLANALDTQLLTQCASAINDAKPIQLDLTISNINRTVGTMLGSAVTKKWGSAGLPSDTITLRFTGSAGQSLGAFLPKGISIHLHGDANDYLGKGLSGGRIVLRPSTRATFRPQDNVIAGNVIGYGATSGEIFINGLVGERFCVRNSGATAVVEGIGDHGCEYMTGGRVVVLGETGRNFAAGMSGGIAYVYDEDGMFASRVNAEMVDVVKPTVSDASWLRETIEQHVQLTESPLGAGMLEDWATASGKFRKVLPRDYARVMAIIDQAKIDGVSDEETSRRVMEPVNG
jgi:glutamate synthase (NADPH/NADH) large chain